MKHSGCFESERNRRLFRILVDTKFAAMRRRGRAFNRRRSFVGRTRSRSARGEAKEKTEVCAALACRRLQIVQGEGTSKQA